MPRIAQGMLIGATRPQVCASMEMVQRFYGGCGRLRGYRVGLKCGTVVVKGFGVGSPSFWGSLIFIQLTSAE